MHPVCPNCGHVVFVAVGRPGRAACRTCGTVSTREAALMASRPGHCFPARGLAEPTLPLDYPPAPS